MSRDSIFSNKLKIKRDGEDCEYEHRSESSGSWVWGDVCLGLGVCKRAATGGGAASGERGTGAW